MFSIIKKQYSQKLKMSSYDIDMTPDFLPELFDKDYSDYLLNKLMNRAQVREVITERDVKLHIVFGCAENRDHFFDSLTDRFGPDKWDVLYLDDIDRLDCVITINKL